MVVVVSVVFSVAAELGLFFSPSHITLFISIENHLPFYQLLTVGKPIVIFHVQLEYLSFIGKCFILLAGYFTSMLNS